jgi:DNA replication protein DnaC
VIDDISAQLATAGYYRERFFQVFNHRFDAQLPTVLTTAADEKELDGRLKSRIFLSDYCQVRVLKVEPYRGKKKIARRK